MKTNSILFFILIITNLLSCGSSSKDEITSSSSEKKVILESDTIIVTTPDTIHLGMIPPLSGDTTITRNIFIQNNSNDTISIPIFSGPNAYGKTKISGIMPHQKSECELVIAIGRDVKGKHSQNVNIVFQSKNIKLKKTIAYTYEMDN